MSYLSGNITRTDSGLSIDELATVRSADIVTMVKFFSTVAAFIRKDDAHGNLLKKIFSTKSLRHLQALGGMTETLFEWHGMISLPCVVHSESVQLIKELTGFEPLQQCTVSIVLLRKPLQTEGTEGSPVTYGSTLAVTHKIGFGWGQRRPWHQTLFPKPGHRYRLRLGRRNKDDSQLQHEPEYFTKLLLKMLVLHQRAHRIKHIPGPLSGTQNPYRKRLRAATWQVHSSSISPTRYFCYRSALGGTAIRKQVGYPF